MLRERGMLGREVDGVAVERRLERDAILERAVERCRIAGLFDRGERGLEIDVLGLEARRRDVGDVRGEQPHALRTHFERCCMNAEKSVVGHGCPLAQMYPRPRSDESL